MAVKIRLKRMGQKKAPFYRIVVADAKSPRDGRFIAEIGTYDPTKDPSVYKVDEEAAQKWLKNGAQPTAVVEKIFKLAGIQK
ncbi:MAG: 30S ribosomal protein S16 [Bilifractor sp.]